MKKLNDYLLGQFRHPDVEVFAMTTVNKNTEIRISILEKRLSAIFDF